MSMDIKLMCCPFCGSVHIQVDRKLTPDGQASWIVFCRHCAAQVNHPDRDRAVARWNTRVDTFHSERLRYECLLAQLRKP